VLQRQLGAAAEAQAEEEAAAQKLRAQVRS